MQKTLTFKQLRAYSTLFLLLFLATACTKNNVETPAELSITMLSFEKTFEATYLDLPDGVYEPDHPDFSMSNPETWTGNMAQYVKTNYRYEIQYTIRNNNSATAYDVEFDLYTYFKDGSEDYQIYSVGNIGGGQEIYQSFTKFYTDQEIEDVYGEVFWFH